MKNIFKNTQEHRLRAGWRILFFVIIFWSLSTVVLAIRPLLGDISKSEFVSGYSLLIVAVLAIAASIAVPIARKYFDKKSFRSLGLVVNARTWSDLIFGILLSGLMGVTFLALTVQLDLVEIQGFNFMSLSEAIESSTGFLTFTGIFSLGSMCIFFIEYILVAYWEELVFRGYLFQNLREGIGQIAAIIFSCILFGLIHYANPNATMLSTGIIMLFGFIRIYGYLVTRMLWLSIGMHIGWNFFQGPILGFAASGHQHATFLNLRITGPEWLSGGEFGPEGSVLILPILAVTVFIMHLWGKRGRTLSENSPFKDRVSGAGA